MRPESQSAQIEMTKEHKDEEYVTKEDIFDYTIDYALGNGYPSKLAKGQRCAVLKSSKTSGEEQEVLIQKKVGNVKVVTSAGGRQFILLYLIVL